MAKGPRTGRVGGRTSRVPALKHLDSLVKAAPLPPPAEEEVPADVAVLTEIRDLLAERRGGPTSGTTAL